jgi:hypothetical protein
MYVASVAAVVDGNDLPASFDGWRWRESTGTALGFDCFTMCTMGCFAAGFPLDHCHEVCAQECADDVGRYPRRLLQ